ncbi:hypothetical protein [Nocardioides aurantiacus]|uniref:Uncharacterized protein n=1 Tax=Nocardioides aurantiacus TaxID=86796 RepID=A0A3N2CXG4_9ACTN|nr:hypothetical protein [Nocardioides aurantiacus]ROR92227.1 hypothetical protein EDD33_3113 [Nocardioides aurantiacus]
MLITNHVLSGALVGRAAPGPVSAFALGVASHFAIDTVPHWGDDRIFLQVAVPDGLVGLGAMAWVWRTTEASARVRVLAGMAGACLPDADKPSTLFFGRSPFPAAVDEWHRGIQRESVRRLPQEFAVAALGVLVVRRLSRAAGRRAARPTSSG